MGIFVPNFDSETNDFLQISLESMDGIQECCIVKLDGFVDTYNSTFFQNQITKVISAGYSKLIFDCKELSYVSSTGIGAFINIWKSLSENAGTYIFMNVQKKVYDVFQILGFAGSFSFVENKDEAKAVLKKNK